MRQSEWEKEKAIHILELVRSELYIDMTHFLTALYSALYSLSLCLNVSFGYWEQTSEADVNNFLDGVVQSSLIYGMFSCSDITVPISNA